MNSFIQKYYTPLSVALVLGIAIFSYLLGGLEWGSGLKDDHVSITSVLEVGTINKAPALDNLEVSKTTTDRPSLVVAEEGDKGLYVGSKNGTKYYTPGCSGANRIKPENYIWFRSVEDAQLQGYSKGSC